MSNLHHQTANASTNTPIHENQYLTSPITSKSASTELGGISATVRNANTSISLATTTNLTNKINKIQDPSSFNFNTNPESTPTLEKKPLTVSYYHHLICYEIYLIVFFSKETSPTSSIDPSRFCRFIFPDQTSTLLLTHNSTNLTIQQAINRLFAKRGITWYRTELYSTSVNEQVKKIKYIFIYPNYYIEQELIM